MHRRATCKKHQNPSCTSIWGGAAPPHQPTLPPLTLRARGCRQGLAAGQTSASGLGDGSPMGEALLKANLKVSQNSRMVFLDSRIWDARRRNTFIRSFKIYPPGAREGLRSYSVHLRAWLPLDDSRRPGSVPCCATMCRPDPELLAYSIYFLVRRFCSRRRMLNTLSKSSWRGTARFRLRNTSFPV